MTARKSADQGACASTTGAPGQRHRSPASGHRALVAGIAVTLAVLALQPATAAEPEPVTIAVFDFELDDRSAGGGVVGQDAVDTENLRKSTDEARRRLAESGRYSVIDVASAAADAVPKAGFRHCNGCEAPLARRLGADRSMVGVFARVSRTEYTLQIVVRDAATGAILTNDFTGLRMGANYAWPRGVKWLMDNKILSAQRAE